jgi:hypothetical protein
MPCMAAIYHSGREGTYPPVSLEGRNEGVGLGFLDHTSPRGLESGDRKNNLPGSLELVGSGPATARSRYLAVDQCFNATRRDDMGYLLYELYSYIPTCSHRVILDYLTGDLRVIPGTNMAPTCTLHRRSCWCANVMYSIPAAVRS